MEAVSSVVLIAGRALCLAERVKRRILMVIYRPLFASHGRHFWFDPLGDYSFANIRVGDDVFIGPGAMFIAANTTIEIGNKVMFGPGVTILGGDHNTSVLGRFMYDVKEKRAGDDQPVIIEDDVWVGARAVILKGVRVGRGAIIAAGAVATKNVPPYSVTGGSPARVLKWRWTVDQIIAHEEQIYPVARRLSASELYAERSVE